MTIPRRGDIYLVEFDPARGHEVKKTRPALVIQNDIGNRYSPVTIVAVEAQPKAGRGPAAGDWPFVL
jgi:mRNA-degrading endonuclease toxin of MazEF toxin-antitoxin module